MAVIHYFTIAGFILVSSIMYLFQDRGYCKLLYIGIIKYRKPVHVVKIGIVISFPFLSPDSLPPPPLPPLNYLPYCLPWWSQIWMRKLRRSKFSRQSWQRRLISQPRFHCRSKSSRLVQPMLKRRSIRYMQRHKT